MRRIVAAAIALLLSSCSDEEPSLTTSADPVALATTTSELPLRFDIGGHWEGITFQGRRIAFDVSPGGMVRNGRINLHHDCSTGSLRMTMDGYRAQVNDHTFSATLNWRIVDKDSIYSGTVTISGRFESAGVSRGALANSVTRKPPDDIYGRCLSIFGTWEAFKE